jgi:flagellar basal body-associated protein FliL
VRRLVAIIGLLLVLGWPAQRGTAAEGGGAAGQAAPGPASNASGDQARRYITLAPLLVSVIRHDDVHKLVTLIITLELADPDKRAEIEHRMPLLRDAFLTDLQWLFGLGLYDDRTVDLERIKARLLAISQRVMGQGVIHDVLILNAFERAV